MNYKLFGDKSHIIYVNASSPNLKTALGKLVADLCCSDPEKANYPEIAKTLRYFKLTPKGLKTMNDEFAKWAQDIADEARKEGREEGREEGRAEGREKGKDESRVEFAIKLIQRGGMAIEEIADLTGLSQKNVQKLVAQKAA